MVFKQIQVGNGSLKPIFSLKIVFLFFFFSFFYTSIFAQTLEPIDTVASFREAITILRSRKNTEKALYLLQQTVDSYAQKKDKKAYFVTKILGAETAWILKPDAKNIAPLEALLSELRQYSPAFVVEEAYFSARLAHIYIDLGKLAEAQNLLKTAEKLTLLDPMPYQAWARTKLLSAKGRIATEQGKHEEAIACYKNALACIGPEPTSTNQSSAALLYKNIGASYEYLENYSLAALYYKKSFDYFNQNFKNTIGLAEAHYNISYIAERQGDYEQAIEHYQAAAKIWLDLSGETADVADCYMAIASSYLEQHDADRAELFARKAEVIIKKIIADNPEKAYTLYSLLADIAMYHQQKTTAIDYAKKAVLIAKKLDSEQILAKTIVKLGNIQQESQDFAGAKASYEAAIAHYKTLKNAAKTANTTLALLKLTVQSESLTDAQKKTIADELVALNSVFEKNHNTQNAALSTALLAVVNQKKGEKLSDLYTKKAISLCLSTPFDGEKIVGSEVVYNDVLLSVFSLFTTVGNPQERAFYRVKTLQLLTFLRQASLATRTIDTKINVAQEAKQVIEAGIADIVSLQAAGNHSADFAAALFELIEHGKSINLLTQQKKNRAQQRAALPRIYLEVENAVNAHLTDLRLQLADLQEADKSPEKQADLQAKILTLTQQYDLALRTIYKQFPIYKHLSTAAKTLSLAALQTLLADDEAFATYYFSAEKGLIALFITRKTVETKIIGSSESQVSAAMTQLQTALFAQMPLPNDLFERCKLADLIHLKTIKHLVISPDGVLYRLPFEALKVADAAKSTAQLPYLLESHSICYTPSAAIYSMSLERSSEGFGSGLLAIAPVFKGGNKADLRTFPLQNLPFAVKEATEIAQLYGGDSLVNTAATESFFREKAANYGILHLATHALLDTIDPLKTSLVFTQKEEKAAISSQNEPKTSNDDGFLAINDVFNLRLKAELVTLSACNTAAGRTGQQGEGVQSLARSFAEAGVPNLVATQWQLADRSGAKIMVAFYENLKQGLAKDEALRQAKLDFLKHADSRSTAPFYWAGAVLIGNRNPMQAQRVSFFKPKNTLIFGIVVLMLGLFSFTWYKKRVSFRTSI